MNRYAIVVSYEPNILSLKNLCTSIINQGFRVVLVDNSEKIILKDYFYIKECEIITNKQNLGIAYAQNVGVKYAISQGADIITFFDQDSIIFEGLLDKLSEPLFKNNLSITLPVSIDKVSGSEYPSQVVNKFGWVSDIYAKGLDELVPVNIAISSGTTTSVDVFKRVGFFDEDFFIDFVDIEWFIRSKRMGINAYIVPGAVMEHSIGDNVIVFGPITCIQHSPIRTYYKVRNSILLFRKRINVLFSIRQVIPALFQNLILMFFVKNKAEYFRYYIKGICHGIVGRVGKYY